MDSIEDYTKLYDGHWENSLPGNPYEGILTNYTDDLLFSMERLSNSPYQVQRLNPQTDSLNFQVGNSITKKLTTMTQQQLFDAGRLFYADYRDQSVLSPTPGHHAAACDAFFYIHPTTSAFLPLAIRTNIGANLIYTPADTPQDWTLAKMMYNVNDFWFAQWNHLASTHEVVQIGYMAAIRSLSEEHPVLALLNRLMYEVFAVQPAAALILFSMGGAVDLLFPYDGTSARDYTTRLYETGGSGRFQGNYFERELERRGLVGSKEFPALKHFPFYEDGSRIHSAIRSFMASFVDSYYSEDSDLGDDNELQNWAGECNGDANCIDFPTSFTSKDTLVDVLTHFAHLASVSHQTVNTNELLQVSSTLPMHPPSLYSPLPSSKGVTNVADYLPSLPQCLAQFTVGALFARPKLFGVSPDQLCSATVRMD